MSAYVPMHAKPKPPRQPLTGRVIRPLRRSSRPKPSRPGLTLAVLFGVLAAVCIASILMRQSPAPRAVSKAPKPAPAVRHRPAPPKASPAALKPSAAPSYTVKSGDTVWTVAYAHKISAVNLESLNHLKPPYTLSPGQKLKI